MKKAIIFDFGGVLMKTVDYTPRLNWDNQLGLPHGSVERSVHNADSWVQAQHGAIPIEFYWADVAQRLHLTPEQVKLLAEDFYSGDQLDSILMDLIISLRSDGHHVALLSNDSSELRPKLMKLGIDKFFYPLIISAEIGVMKPDPEAYNAVLSALQLPAEQTIFIDDRLDNVKGAQALQINGIHYNAQMNLANTLASLL